MMSLTWTLRRLRAMSAQEMAFRLQRSARMLGERLSPARDQTTIASRADTPATPREPLLEFDCAIDASTYEHAAHRIVSGNWRVLGLDEVDVGWPPRWNRDPKTSVDAPLTFGRTLDYRNEALVGNIKYLWEINRHAELVTLAQAFYLTRRVEHAEACRTLIDSSLEQCPYPNGPNWSSSLELAIRLINWAIAWDLLGGDESPLFTDARGSSFKSRWLASVYQHCRVIDSHRSLYSSANNHLLGELAGLYVASVCWPQWAESQHWRNSALARFEEEALKQNAPDGVNREQAIYYQHEVADMMILVGLIDRRHGDALSQSYWARLEAMLEFIAAVMDYSGNVPMIGDGDDARLVRFDPDATASVYRSLLATGAALFGRIEWKAKARSFDDKSRWLLGADGQAAFDALSVKTVPERKAFTEGGYYMLSADRGSASEILCVADAGPLGYLSIAAHGHADALAFTLSVAGKPVLIDPGTYAYHTEPHWRRYFRGTSAHNTARVDGVDQSEQGGSFLWLSKAESSVEHWSSSATEDHLVASHDGYRRLPDPVVHKRDIRLLKNGYSSERALIVVDEFACAAHHLVELHWHFSDRCAVVLNGAGCIATVDQLRVEMQFAGPDGTAQIFHGGDELGWVSHRFDKKLPAPTVRWSSPIVGPARFTTTIRILVSR